MHKIVLSSLNLMHSAGFSFFYGILVTPKHNPDRCLDQQIIQFSDFDDVIKAY